ncbi:hypothetical protein D3C74_213220 [compost metagenome]
MQNKNTIKRLVKNNCACYLGAKHSIPNYCCLQDSPCVFFAQYDSLPRCTYFENGVLPMDEKLVQEYKSDRNVEIGFNTAKPRVNCKKCGKTFSANSNRQKYCEKSRGKNANEKTKFRMRQMRKKQA